MTGSGHAQTPAPAWRGRLRVERPRLVLVLLAALCFGAALVRPGWTWPADSGAALLVVDVTQSMNVADAGDGGAGRPQTRLAWTRGLLRDVVRELPCGHAVGIGVFAERRTLPLIAPVEVCAHRAALDDVIGGLDWRMAWAADSHLYYGVQTALDQIAGEWPGTALAFFSDGNQAPSIVPGREPRFDRREPPLPGVLFGVGGETPMPVPHMEADGRISGYWTAEEAAAFAPTGGQRTLSVAEMEAMARGGRDVRNAAPERAAGPPAHLSRRDDALLDTVARAAGLMSTRALDSPSVVRLLRSQPSVRRAPVRHELHDPLVVTGAVLLLASLLPWPHRLERGLRKTFEE